MGRIGEIARWLHSAEHLHRMMSGRSSFYDKLRIGTSRQKISVIGVLAAHRCISTIDARRKALVTEVAICMDSPGVSSGPSWTECCRGHRGVARACSSAMSRFPTLDCFRPRDTSASILTLLRFLNEDQKPSVVTLCVRVKRKQPCGRTVLPPPPTDRPPLNTTVRRPMAPSAAEQTAA